MEEEIEKLMWAYLGSLKHHEEEPDFEHPGIPDVLWSYIRRISYLAKDVHTLSLLASEAKSAEAQALGKVLALLHADYELVEGLAWEDELDTGASGKSAKPGNKKTKQ